MELVEGEGSAGLWKTLQVTRPSSPTESILQKGFVSKKKQTTPKSLVHKGKKVHVNKRSDMSSLNTHKESSSGCSDMKVDKRKWAIGVYPTQMSWVK